MKVVGILVSEKVFRNIKFGKTGHENLQFYNKSAVKCDLIPFYMCLRHTRPKSRTAFGYVYSKGTYKYTKFPLPAVIHIRTIPASGRMKHRLKLLRRTSYLFNSQNRYSKYRIHMLLKDRFAANLPFTVHYTKANLRSMLENFGSVYIKPQSDSAGRGIMKLTFQRNEKWKVQSSKGSFITTKKRAQKIVNRIAKFQKYLIQETIPLAKYNGKPYDIRVSVQRGKQGSWQVTGMVGKVAKKGSYVTNVARGGTVKKCGELFKGNMLNPEAVKQSVKALSLNMSHYLGERLKHLADVGLDIGVTPSGKTYLIELNCQDQRYSFKEAGMRKTYYRTYENPILYAKYLLNKLNNH